MRKDTDPDVEPQFEWDMATWIVIALVVLLGLLLAVMIWPHPFVVPE